VQLDNGVCWTFTHIILAGYSDVLASAATRYCLLRDQRPGEYGGVMLRNIAAVSELPCQPMPYREQSAL
jgi:hypothetical protein